MWWRQDRQAVLDMMVEVKSAVQGALGRLDADFAPNSLYLCFEVFDLAAWQTILRAGSRAPHPPDAAPDAAPDTHRLLRKGRHIFEALGAEWNPRSFMTAVEAALACRAHVAPAAACAKQGDLGCGLGVNAGPGPYARGV